MGRQRGWVSVTMLVLLLLLLALVWWQRLALFDWIRLRNYSPPSAVATLAADDTMTPKATHVFYVNHPDLEDRTTFNQHCPAGSEKTIVLGCYHGNQQGIFLYSVTDVRLNGVEQVTAAHEMLHAAYDRLSTKQRNYVDGLLEDYYQHDLHDQRLLNTIAAYQKSEPNDVVNEMHSVFGTEIAQLPPALETYYQQYFVNRRQVAAYAASYQAEFVNRQNQVSTDDAQLSQLKTEFTADEADLQTKDADLRSLQTTMNAERQAGQIDAFNANVPVYNAKVNAFNAEITATKKLIDQYNQLVTARNAIAVEEQQLEQALDSRLSPLTAQ